MNGESLKIFDEIKAEFEELKDRKLKSIKPEIKNCTEELESIKKVENEYIQQENTCHRQQINNCPSGRYRAGNEYAVEDY